MRSLQDVIYNWLTIKLVVEKRPHDEAAEETYSLFQSILTEDHQVSHLSIERLPESYVVHFIKEDKPSSFRFPKELAETMIALMEQEPEKFL